MLLLKTILATDFVTLAKTLLTAQNVVDDGFDELSTTPFELLADEAFEIPAGTGLGGKAGLKQTVVVTFHVISPNAVWPTDNRHMFICYH